MNQKKSDDTSWRGNCYINAINFVVVNKNYCFDEMVDEKSLKVVHGIVTGCGEENKGFRMCHAWVEDKNFCYDHDAETNLITQIPKFQYYTIGEVELTDLEQYGPKEILIEVSKHGHAGPWTEKLINHAVNEEGSVYIVPKKETDDKSS